MLLGNSFGQTVHTHHASVHQAAKLVAALLRVVEVTAGLVESNGSLPPGISMIVIRQNCLQCFDAVGWAAGRASGL